MLNTSIVQKPTSFDLGSNTTHDSTTVKEDELLETPDGFIAPDELLESATEELKDIDVGLEHLSNLPTTSLNEPSNGIGGLVPITISPIRGSFNNGNNSYSFNLTGACYTDMELLIAQLIGANAGDIISINYSHPSDLNSTDVLHLINAIRVSKATVKLSIGYITSVVETLLVTVVQKSFAAMDAMLVIDNTFFWGAPVAAKVSAEGAVAITTMWVDMLIEANIMTEDQKTDFIENNKVVTIPVEKLNK